jgi:hypothetical protein
MKRKSGLSFEFITATSQELKDLDNSLLLKLLA